MLRMPPRIARATRGRNTTKDIRREKAKRRISASKKRGIWRGRPPQDGRHERVALPYNVALTTNLNPARLNFNEGGGSGQLPTPLHHRRASAVHIDGAAGDV